MDLSYYRECLAKSIKAKERTKRTGLTPNGRRIWSAEEDDIFRTLYPDYPAIRAALPDRNLKGLHERGARLGLARPLHWWKASEITRLRRLYPTASRATLHEEFPGVSWIAIGQAAVKRGIYRARRRYKRTGFLPIDEILGRLEELGWTLKDLDEESKTGKYFRNGYWRRSKPNYGKLARAVRALDGKFVVEWTTYK